MYMLSITFYKKDDDKKEQGLLEEIENKQIKNYVYGLN